MLKLTTLFFSVIVSGAAFAQARMIDQAPVGQVEKSASSKVASSNQHVSSSSYVGSAQRENSSSVKMDADNHRHAEANAFHASSYSETDRYHYGKVIYTSSNASSQRGHINENFSTVGRLEMPKQEVAVLVFETQPLMVGNKTSIDESRNLGFDRKSSVSIINHSNELTYGGGNAKSFHQPVSFNPFYDEHQQLQSSEYNKERFSFTCQLTGLSTGYLSNHRCSGCMGYYHYWRTYTNFGCFEYLNGHINKVQSVNELKELIQSYYDCIDYYQQYNFVDPNTRAEFRYKVGH